MPAAGGRLPAAGQAPDPAQEEAVDEVGGVQKKLRAVRLAPPPAAGTSASASKVACSARRSSVGAGPGIAPVLRRRSPNCLSTLPTWAGLRSIPVNSAMRALASTRVAGGRRANAATIAAS